MYTQLQKKPDSFKLVPESLLTWLGFKILSLAITNVSIKIMQMEFRIAVTNVRRHSSVHTFSDNIYIV